MSARTAPDPAPAGAAREGGMETPADKVRTGRFTALLQQIAAVPDDEPGAAWSEWLSPGAVVGRFEMVREIGRGGFGVVWEARDQKLGRSVAFKAVRAGAKAQLREERLLREAEAAARLSHPNIVTLHDVGRAEQGPYLVLELLVGETLAERLGRGTLPVREAVRVAVEIAKGVAHAHAHGVVHRDLKPANVVLCRDGQVKVLDFGMAHAFGQRREDGGTPAYMAPEQREGAPEDERSDVFALGAMLFEMTSGELPFPERGGRIGRAPELVVPEAPALGELVGRMLERDPTRRPRDGAEALVLLSQAQRTLQEAAVTPVAMVRSPVRARRRPGLRAAAFIAAGVLLGVGVAIFAMRDGSEPASAAFDGRPTVAVADFANETRDPDLDGLSGLLITSLEQSKKLRVFTRGRLIDLAREGGRSDPSRIDESLAREVGRKAGVKTLLLASIQKLGDTYAAELRAVDPRKDEYLFTIREQATAKNDLLPLIDRMSDRIRLELHESAADVKASEVNVAEAVTANLEAHRHYFLAKDLAARVRLKEALGEFQKALQIDPRFALAQVDAAWIGFMSARKGRAEARALVREAARNASKAPAKEAGLIRILDAFFDGRFAASRADIRMAMSRYPDDREVAMLGAAVLSFSGFAEEALPALERTVRLAPDWDILRFEQVGILASLGRAREAVDVAEATARQRGTPTARAVVGLARLMTGDVEGGVQALRASKAEDSLSHAFLAEGLAAQGKFDEAFAAVAPFDDSTADTTRAIVLAYAGRLHEGLRHLEAAGRRPGAEFTYMAPYLAAAGDVESARKATRRDDFFIASHGVMLALIGDERRLSEHLAQMGTEPILHTRLLRAVTAYLAGDHKAALADLRAIDKGTSLAPYFHGLAAAKAGLDEEALDAFRRFEQPAFCGGEGFQVPWFLARARLVMARSLDRLGKRDEARKVLDLQLARWKDADPDLPLLTELKAFRKQLDVSPDVK